MNQFKNIYPKFIVMHAHMGNDLIISGEIGTGEKLKYSTSRFACGNNTYLTGEALIT